MFVTDTIMSSKCKQWPSEHSSVKWFIEYLGVKGHKECKFVSRIYNGGWAGGSLFSGNINRKLLLKN